MGERIEFNKKGEAILDFLDAYEVVKREHIEKFFPNSEKILNYLIKNQRLYKSSDEIYVSITHNHRPNKSIITAMSILADIFEKVQSHIKATAPAQISFVTHSGDYYEIVYVGYGMEAMIAAAYETQLTARQLSTSYVDTTKRMVIVEDKNQMTRLQIPGLVRFILVQPDGSLSYFNGGS